MVYDAAVIGTGPAGLSAAITLKIRGKNIIWFGSGQFSSKIEKASNISNYPGLGMISGHQLNENFKAHGKALDLTVTERLVTNIIYDGKHFTLLAENEMYNAESVLLAPGVMNGKKLEGEAEFTGRGVSYCATCDGMFFKGKRIAVYCEDSSFASEVSYLAGVAEKVFLFSPDPNLLVLESNVGRANGRLLKIEGSNKVEAVELSNGESVPVDGVFLLRNAISPSHLLPGLELDGPHIAVNRQLQTNIEGCFAAGDITGRPYQIAKAIGEGNVAAHEILEYLAKK